MPNRIIKESALTSGSLRKLSAEAERLFWRLVVVADDFGRFIANPAVVKAKCFPLRVDEFKTPMVQKWLQEIVNGEMVTIYEVDLTLYGQFNNFEKHNGKRRAKHSKYPAPGPGKLYVAPSMVIDPLLEAADSGGTSRNVAADSGGTSRNVSTFQTEENQHDSICEQMLADASKCPRDTRHETRDTRSETREGTAQARSLIVPPNWVSKETWDEFYAAQVYTRRRKSAAPFSQSIADRIFKVIDRLRAKGYGGNAILHKMIDKGWVSIEEEWIDKPGKDNPHGRPEPKGFDGVRHYKEITGKSNA